MTEEFRDFYTIKEKARRIYDAQKAVYNPYFGAEVVFNSDGFHHLQFSGRSERNKKEQVLKFSLLTLAIKVIKKSGTVQEHRKGIITTGKRGKDELFKTKNVEYWAFIAIVGEREIKIRVIIRRVGDGNFTFWSVMPDSNFKNQKLYEDSIVDE